MKTTVEITDALFREARRYAAEHGMSFRHVVEAGLRQVLKDQAGPRKPFRMRRRPFHGDGLQAGYQWPAIRAVIYEGRGE